MKNKLLALLILVSVNLPVFSVVPQFIKTPDVPVKLDLEQSKKISKLKNEFTEFQLLIEQEAPQQLLRARKKGGGGTASATLVGRYGLNLDGSIYFLDIIDGTLSKSGNGAIEYVLYDQYGNLIDNSVGVVQKNVLSFFAVFFNGAELINLALDPKNGFNGSGVFMVRLISECVDNSGDGFVDLGEVYHCQYLGSVYNGGPATLTRLSR
jgi:hypothetical protein